MSKSAGTPATVALTALGVTYTIHTYKHDASASSYGIEAATALGLDPACVFKTLIADADGRLVVGIVPVDCQLDLRALASVVAAKKVSLADPSAAQRSSGYVLGGISPIGQKKQLMTVIDETAQLFEVVYVSGGKRGMDIGIAPEDLARATNATFAAIAK